MPLVERFPALAAIPRVTLGRTPTPVEPLGTLSSTLWIKRDDRFADPFGGNKARALEFLLGGVAREQRVVSVGSAASTHALSLAVYGRRVGAEVEVGLWRQEMNPTATVIAARLARARGVRQFASPVTAMTWGFIERLRGATWIAAGGSTPLGILGHVNAGLELVDQIDAGLLPQPSVVVLPLGTGGTAAGLALAFAIAGRDITVVGARVVPRLVARRGRVLSLARHTALLIESHTGTRLPRVPVRGVEVVHTVYGGAYGRETPAAAAITARAAASGIAVDGTYSAKALAHAATLASRAAVLFWLTFDSRILTAPLP